MSKITFTLSDTLDKLNLTVNALSNLSGVRTATLYDMINNKSALIRLDTLQAILDALNAYDPANNYTIDDIVRYKK
jgi:predicted transcriptional regulator